MAPIVVIGAIEQNEEASVLVLPIHQPLRKHNEGNKHRYESSNCDELHLFLLPVFRIWSDSLGHIPELGELCGIEPGVLVGLRDSKPHADLDQPEDDE